MAKIKALPISIYVNGATSPTRHREHLIPCVVAGINEVHGPVERHRLCRRRPWGGRYQLLVKQGVKDHEAKVADIFSRHSSDLRNFLGRYLRSSSDVEDCIQEAFLKLWRQETKGLLREDARGYLFTTALNVVRDFWRKESSRKTLNHVQMSEDLVELRSDDSEKVLVDREGIRLIEAKLATLKPSTRRVFLLHHVENLDFDQIAQKLGVSVRTVEREMARSLEHLRTELGHASKDLLG